MITRTLEVWLRSEINLTQKHKCLLAVHFLVKSAFALPWGLSWKHFRRSLVMFFILFDSAVYDTSCNIMSVSRMILLTDFFMFRLCNWLTRRIVRYNCRRWSFSGQVLAHEIIAHLAQEGQLVARLQFLCFADERRRPLGIHFTCMGAGRVRFVLAQRLYSRDVAVFHCFLAGEWCYRTL